MKKITKLTVGTVVLAGVFALGLSANEGVTNAGSSVSTTVVNTANSLIGKAGFDKKEEIKNRNFEEEILAEIDPEIEQRIKELQARLEALYQSNLENYKETAEYKQIMVELDKIMNSIYTRYAPEVNNIFK